MFPKKKRNNPKNYDGTKKTSHHVKDLLTRVLGQTGKSYQQRLDLIITAWPSIIGPSIAPMTQVTSLSEGVLKVKVKSSTLYSLLQQHEKARILAILKQRFPKARIEKILFRIG